MSDAAGTNDEKPHPLARIIPALHHRNFRLFAIGQILSIIGTWMQDVAQAWYILSLIHI